MLIICFIDDKEILRYKPYHGTLEEFEKAYPKYKVRYVFTKEDSNSLNNSDRVVFPCRKPQKGG